MIRPFAKFKNQLWEKALKSDSSSLRLFQITNKEVLMQFFVKSSLENHDHLKWLIEKYLTDDELTLEYLNHAVKTPKIFEKVQDKLPSDQRDLDCLISNSTPKLS